MWAMVTIVIGARDNSRGAVANLEVSINQINNQSINQRQKQRV